MVEGGRCTGARAVCEVSAARVECWRPGGGVPGEGGEEGAEGGGVAGQGGAKDSESGAGPNPHGFPVRPSTGARSNDLSSVQVRPLRVRPDLTRPRLAASHGWPQPRRPSSSVRARLAPSRKGCTPAHRPGYARPEQSGACLSGIFFRTFRFSLAIYFGSVILVLR